MKRSLIWVSLLAGAWALVLGACGGKAITGQECGNGLIEGSEICDGTALAGQDCTDHGATGGILACDADCGGFDTSLCGDFECGNGLVEPGESCEATDLDGETCTSQGFTGGTLGCNTDCSFDTSNCTQPGCGDGAVNGTEVCDGTNLNGETCATQGFNAGTLACAASCGSFDTSGCTDYECGDGTIEGPEVCDGANVGTMACTDFGFTGGTLVCTSDCLDYDRSGCSGSGCGNGIREAGEVCDLDDVGGLDCQDFGFDSGILGCSNQCDAFDDTGCYDAACGDGNADGTEACDGADLRGLDCITIAQGFMGGTLACDSSCEYDTASCVAAPTPGDDCANAAALPTTLPVIVSGDTTGQTDDYATGGGDCPGMGNGEGNNSPDVVYELTPTADATYVFVYTPTGYDGSIYIVTDCADIGNTCVGGSESGDAPNDEETLAAFLTTGTTYYVIIDGGWGGQQGGYTLSVDTCTPNCTGKQCGDDGCYGSCGTCTGGDVCDDTTWTCADPTTLPGNDCTNPIVVPAAPYTDQGSTTGRSNDYEGDAACPGLPQTEGEVSSDVVYEFTPTQDGVYSIDYEPTFDGALYIVTDCGDVPGTCIGGSEEASQNPPWNEVVDASLVAGTTYYIILDGGYNQGGQGPSGDYTLTIGAPCLPDCTGKACGPDGCGGSCGACTGGDVCDDTQGLCVDPSTLPGEDCTNPVLVNPANLPFVYLEDTTGSTDAAEHSGGACPGENGGHGSGAGDQAFELSPTVAGVYEISLTTYGWDGVVYITSDCADIDNNCIYSDDDQGTSGTETMFVTLDATATYYIFVDGYENSGEEGPYQLFVGQPCVPNCTGLDCGSDGCGGSCGTCASGEFCDSAQQCVVTPGNTCTNAIAVPSTPYSDAGDTSLSATNDYDTTNGGCAGISGIEGETSADIVYAFTPAATATYTITYTPTFDGALYVATDCADIANTCLAGSEVRSQNAPWDEVLSLDLTAGTTYYIFVDGGINQGGQGPSGPYTLDISAPCTPSCSGLKCGDNGCGGSCGTCQLGEYCDGSQQCSPAPGNQCTSAHTVNVTPYTSSGDTSLMTDDYSALTGYCAGPGSTWDNGVLSGDEVYVFTPSTSTTYDITVDPAQNFDAAFYLVTDCADIANTCVELVDQAGPGGPETMNIALTAGTAYYIVVDGFGDQQREGAYTIDIQ